MVLHILPATKLGFLLHSSHSRALINPILPALLCPFVLKLSISFSLLRRVSSNLGRSSRLFFFQLAQIASETDPNRWQRAIRLLCQTLTLVRAPLSDGHPLDDATFRFSVTMLSL